MIEKLRDLRRAAVEEELECKETLGKNYNMNSFGAGHTAGYINAIDEIIELIGGARG